MTEIGSIIFLVPALTPSDCTMAQASKVNGWTPMVRIDGVWVEYEVATAISQLKAEDADDENAEYYTLDGVGIEKPTKT